MSNAHKGEVSLPVGGETYTLRYSYDSLCALEGITDRGFFELAAEMAGLAQEPGKFRLGTLRAVLWAALREHHKGITLQQAGELIPAAGGVVVIVEKINEALTRAWPEMAKETSEPHPPNPPEGGST
jgi:hypothetical protein